MNINPIIPPVVTALPPIVTTLPPIVTRRVNVVHRTNIINQPIINEEITQICNHNIKRNICCERPICCEQSTFREECDHIGCCSGPMPGPFPGPVGPVPGQVGPGPIPGPVMPGQGLDYIDDANFYGPVFF